MAVIVRKYFYQPETAFLQPLTISHCFFLCDYLRRLSSFFDMIANKHLGQHSSLPTPTKALLPLLSTVIV